MSRIFFTGNLFEDFLTHFFFGRKKQSKDTTFFVLHIFVIRNWHVKSVKAVFIRKKSRVVCWDKLNLDGILLLDFLKYDKKINEIFLDFCKSQNRDGQVYKTRYGTGIVQK